MDLFNVRLNYREDSSSTSWMSPKKQSTQGPPAYLLAHWLSSTPGTHLASSHNDTSPGAIHCFQDEHGMNC